jgi:hypothetical protein
MLICQSSTSQTLAGGWKRKEKSHAIFQAFYRRGVHLSTLTSSSHLSLVFKMAKLFGITGSHP